MQVKAWLLKNGKWWKVWCTASENVIVVPVNNWLTTFCMCIFCNMWKWFWNNMEQFLSVFLSVCGHLIQNWTKYVLSVFYLSCDLDADCFNCFVVLWYYLQSEYFCPGNLYEIFLCFFSWQKKSAKNVDNAFSDDEIPEDVNLQGSYFAEEPTLQRSRNNGMISSFFFIIWIVLKVTPMIIKT